MPRRDSGTFHDGTWVTPLFEFVATVGTIFRPMTVDGCLQWLEWVASGCLARFSEGRFGESPMHVSTFLAFKTAKNDMHHDRWVKSDGGTGVWMKDRVGRRPRCRKRAKGF